MRFELRAITQDGRLESVDCQAMDEHSARQQAESRGYTVLEVRSRRSFLARGHTRFPVQLFSQRDCVVGNALHAFAPRIVQRGRIIFELRLDVDPSRARRSGS